MRAVCNISDYFVLSSAPSTRRVETIARHISERLREKGIRKWRVEGKSDARWIAMDFGDCIAHVFLRESREFYGLERLWADAPKESYTHVCRQPS